MSEFSNETLTALLKDIKNDMKAGFKIMHEKQDKTNGNVKSLELWKARFVGAIIALSALIGWGYLQIF